MYVVRIVCEWVCMFVCPRLWCGYLCDLEIKRIFWKERVSEIRTVFLSVFLNWYLDFSGMNHFS